MNNIGYINVQNYNIYCASSLFMSFLQEIPSKDTNRKIRKTEFIYIGGSKNGSSSSTVNTGKV